MSNIIKPEDIRPGDTIRIIREIEVVNADSVGVETTDRFWRTEKATIELVHRPSPELPTEEGSIIEITRKNGMRDSYLLRGGYWAGFSVKAARGLLADGTWTSFKVVRVGWGDDA